MTRECEALNADNQPCGAPPLKPGTVIDDITVTGRWCRQHDEDLPSSAKIHASRTPEQMGGRPPMPKPAEVARRLIEENVHRILRPHFLTLGLDITDDGQIEVLDQGAVIFGESKDGHVIQSAYEDLGAQIAAAEKLLDRVYGRPKQQTEITGDGGGPVEFVSIAPDPERAASVARLLRDQGAADQG